MIRLAHQFWFALQREPLHSTTKLAALLEFVKDEVLLRSPNERSILQKAGTFLEKSAALLAWDLLAVLDELFQALVGERVLGQLQHH
jgi:hypothetical protein